MKGCEKCRGENLTRKFILPDYVSGSELGRPAGAKGKDVGGGAYYVCLDCGTEMIRPVESLREERRRLWIATLPEAISLPWTSKDGKKSGVDEYYIIHARGEVNDRWGNYMFTLPSDPVTDIASWIDQEIDKMNEYYEE